MKQIAFLFTFTIIISVKQLSAQRVFVPCDSDATKQTFHLYNNLFKQRTKGFIFGHQDDLAYGVHWKYRKDSSDVKAITGDYPGIFGWDLSGIEKGHKRDIDGTLFSNMRDYIKWVYKHGGINTLCWHCPSPLKSGATAWDTTRGTVKSILPNEPFHKLYTRWLDSVAIFIRSLKGPNGEAIPILFRPFHEFTGDWFWWGRPYCSIHDFINIWQFTISYLRNVKHLHNLIIVYNAGDNCQNAKQFMERYPGDKYVDILSFDQYQYGEAKQDSSFVSVVNNKIRYMDSIAKEKHKLIALAETGYEKIPYKYWWTKRLLKAIGTYSLSYLLIWRNAGEIGTEQNQHMHYYVPTSVDISKDDFIQFYKRPETLFLKELTNEKLYK